MRISQIKIVEDGMDAIIGINGNPNVMHRDKCFTVAIKHGLCNESSNISTRQYQRTVTAGQLVKIGSLSLFHGYITQLFSLRKFKQLVNG
jgi:hypothetical protein